MMVGCTTTKECGLRPGLFILAKLTGGLVLPGLVDLPRESKCVGGSKYLMKEEPQQPGAARAHNSQAVQWAQALARERMDAPLK